MPALTTDQLTTEKFKEIFAEFQEVNDEKIRFYLDNVQDNLSETFFGNNYARAVFFLTAHYVYLLQNQGDLVGGQSVGGHSRSYAISTTNQPMSLANFSTSSYGLQFLYLRKSSGVSMFLAGPRRGNFPYRSFPYYFYGGP